MKGKPMLAFPAGYVCRDTGPSKFIVRAASLWLISGTTHSHLFEGSSHPSFVVRAHGVLFGK